MKDYNLERKDYINYTCAFKFGLFFIFLSSTVRRSNSPFKFLPSVLYLSSYTPIYSETATPTVSS